MSLSFQKTTVEEKPPARSLQTLHVYSMSKQTKRVFHAETFHVVSASFQHEHTQCIYRGQQ